MQFDKKQLKIINSKPNGPLVIKGEKGTGKTTTFINKIPALLNRYCIADDDKVLVVTINEEHSKNVAFIYDNIESERYHQNSFFDEDNSNKLEVSTIDSLIQYYLGQYKKTCKKVINIASVSECEIELEKAIISISERYSTKKIKILNIEFTQFIQEEIKWIKACNYASLEEYQLANRIGRVSKVDSEAAKILRKNSKQRQAIFEILSEYNNNLKKIKKLDHEDVELLALEEALNNPSINYTHICIDNSQDLTKVQLELLKSLHNEKNYSSITFIVDNIQSNNHDSWLIKGRSFASLGYDMKGKCISLNKNYSEIITKEIYENNINDTLNQTGNEQNNNITESMILDKIEYIDLKRNIVHKFIKDAGTIDEIYVEDNGIDEKAEEVVRIPVFNEIAAGSPILMNDHMEDSYYLPKEWIRRPKDTFILKVKGDSMINKDIEDGDYVVISKEGMPKVRDIVAVDIDGEATLKTYKNENGLVILMPENEKYSPIIITDQQFGFLGVAIGLIKNSYS